MTIENITVKVTYTVGLGGFTVSRKLLEQLNKIADKGDAIEFGSTEHDEAQQWILENVKERDCMESQFEILDLEPKP